MQYSWLLDASSLLLSLWSVTVMASALATFRRDLIPSQSSSDASRRRRDNLRHL